MPHQIGPIPILAGVATTIYFTLESPLATSSDRLITSSIAGTPIVAGDVQISVAGAALVNTTTLPTQVGVAKPLYAQALTVAETLGDDIYLFYVDQTASPAFRDLCIHLKSVWRMTQLDLDPRAYTLVPDVDGLAAFGRGGGLPFKLTPAGATRHTNLFDTPMGAEPTPITGLVGATRSVGAFMQDLWYRHFRKHKKTGSGSSGQVIVYKEDDLTAISTQTASKTGTEQTIERAV